MTNTKLLLWTLSGIGIVAGIGGMNAANSYGEEGMSAAAFFRADQRLMRGQTFSAKPTRQRRYRKPSRNKARIKSMIAREVTRKIGRRWVPEALRLAYVESRYNCKAIGPRTHYGRGHGIFQVLPRSARGLGYSSRGLRTCRHGIRVGVAHMAMCIRKGARSNRQMRRCHLGGPGAIFKRQRRSAERYHRKYQRMVRVAWAGRLR